MTWKYDRNSYWILIYFFSIVSVVNAEGDISWATVGITWFFCTITTVLILLCVLCGAKLLRKRRKETPLSKRNNDSQRSNHSRASANTRVTILSSTSTEPASDRNSYQPPKNGGLHQLHVDPTAGYRDRNLPRSISEECHRTNRRKTGDFTSKWCTERELSENTAHVLRRNGFISENTLRSLRSEDVASLGLISRAEECVLRNLLEEMRRKSSCRNSKISDGSSSRSVKKRAISSGELQHSESSSQPDANTALLDRAYSETELDEGDLRQFTEGLKKSHSRSTAHSYDVIDGEKSGIFGAQSAIELQPGPSRMVPKYAAPHNNALTNVKGFNGLLSDKGLHTLASQIGLEWQQLGALLYIPTPLLQQIKLDYAGNTHHQIYEMLRLFRDTTSGGKEEIKGKLQVALENVARVDLANSLLQEQVEGSVEKIPYHSIV